MLSTRLHPKCNHIKDIAFLQTHIIMSTVYSWFQNGWSKWQRAEGPSWVASLLVLLLAITSHLLASIAICHDVMPFAICPFWTAIFEINCTTKCVDHLVFLTVAWHGTWTIIWWGVQWKHWIPEHCQGNIVCVGCWEKLRTLFRWSWKRGGHFSCTHITQQMVRLSCTSYCCTGTH